MGHVIKKQILDVKIQQTPDVFQVQHALSHWYWNQLLTILEQAFDTLAPSGEIIQIDKLEIDLGKIDATRFADPNFMQSLQLTLVEELRKAIRDQSSSDNPLVKHDPVLQASRQWLFYMEQGVLSWNLSQIPANWLNNVLKAFATDIASIDKLRKLILQNPLVGLRIIRQHQPSFLTSLLKVLTARQLPELDDLLKELFIIHDILLQKNQSRQTTQQLREQWLLLLLKEATESAHQFDLNKLLITILNSFVQGRKIEKGIMHKISGSTSLLAPALKIFEQESTTYDDQLVNINKPINQPTPETDLSEEPALQDDGNGEGGYDGLYTEMAGLVLLHPFLTMLFTQLNWVEKNTFKNKTCQQKAIGLLHFMATGQTNAPEYALVIAKLLCGYPLKEPVQMEFNFSEDELEEATHLLSVVISRWEVLKRTSVEGLREGFLLRKGKLSETESGMLLQVENGSIDILLDQLPWTISIIKLPWMATMLRVDWR